MRLGKGTGIKAASAYAVGKFAVSIRRGFHLSVTLTTRADPQTGKLLNRTNHL